MKKAVCLMLVLALCAMGIPGVFRAAAKAELPAGRPPRSSEQEQEPAQEEEQTPRQGEDQTPGNTGGPQAPGQGSAPQTPGQGNEAQTPYQDVDENAAQLGLQWDSGRGRRGGYVLLVNGNALTWGQDISSAVDFCTRNGIPMERYDDGNGYSGEQDIVFARAVPLFHEYAFYADQGAGDMTGKLYTVRMYVSMAAGTAEEAAELAQEVFNRLRTVLGELTGPVRVYTGSGFSDIPGEDQYSAVIRMVRSVEDDYGFTVVDFNNLSLYVSLQGGRITVCLYLSGV